MLPNRPLFFSRVINIKQLFPPPNTVPSSIKVMNKRTHSITSNALSEIVIVQWHVIIPNNLKPKYFSLSPWKPSDLDTDNGLLKISNTCYELFKQNTNSLKKSKLDFSDKTYKLHKF